MLKFLIFIFFLASCGLTTTRPKLQMSLAQSAFLAAKQSKADEKAKSLYRKAEIYYIKAKSAYRRKYFNKAKHYAELSIKFSERAEYQAKLKSEDE
jgi:hypothetical protein